MNAVETAIPLPLDEIEAVCRRRGVRRLALFGSVLGSGFDNESDVDFLVEFEPGCEQPWAGHLTDLQEELAALLGRPVDVVDWAAIERSRNPFRRHGILRGRRLLIQHLYKSVTICVELVCLLCTSRGKARAYLSPGGLSLVASFLTVSR